MISRRHNDPTENRVRDVYGGLVFVNERVPPGCEHVANDEELTCRTCGAKNDPRRFIRHDIDPCGGVMGEIVRRRKIFHSDCPARQSFRECRSRRLRTRVGENCFRERYPRIGLAVLVRLDRMCSGRNASEELHSRKVAELPMFLKRRDDESGAETVQEVAVLKERAGNEVAPLPDLREIARDARELHRQMSPNHQMARTLSKEREEKLTLKEVG